MKINSRMKKLPGGGQPETSPFCRSWISLLRETVDRMNDLKYKYNMRRQLLHTSDMLFSCMGWWLLIPVWLRELKAEGAALHCGEVPHTIRVPGQDTVSTRPVAPTWTQRHLNHTHLWACKQVTLHSQEQNYCYIVHHKHLIIIIKNMAFLEGGQSRVMAIYPKCYSNLGM